MLVHLKLVVYIGLLSLFLCSVSSFRPIISSVTGNLKTQSVIGNGLNVMQYSKPITALKDAKNPKEYWEGDWIC
jgi:hypothetical protein